MHWFNLSLKLFNKAKLEREGKCWDLNFIKGQSLFVKGSNSAVNVAVEIVHLALIETQDS